MFFIAHIVTCIYCKKKFDRDKLPYQQVSARRYAHLACFQNEEIKKSKEEQDKEKLEKYIMKMFNETYINAKVRKQINMYLDDYNYSYSGILKALIYFFEVKGNPIDKANGGIGIVPWIYNDAYNYYYNLWLANQKNEDKVIEDYIPKDKVIKIPVPERKIRKRKLFSFLDNDEEVDNE